MDTRRRPVGVAYLEHASPPHRDARTESAMKADQEAHLAPDTDEAGRELSARHRIIEAAFRIFAEKGYESASTLAIATQAKVSKRDIYANFGTKQDMLLACIEGRTGRMNLGAALPRATSAAMLEDVLASFASRLLVEVTDPVVTTIYRLAIAEVARAPEIARVLDQLGRKASHQALTTWLAQAQQDDLLGEGEASRLATEFLALAWNDLRIDLLLGVTQRPTAEALAEQARQAARSFVRLRGKPAMRARRAGA
ncbi:TetR/AcrR family transcriptional regulator [Burkholderia plantarii]|uniref:TetR/AcrR family transcriptional regulator n=1 Tax=Burkholderia plantarii TaxID=41899 RepID=UPI0018DDB553|nr:TetR/AcrR family transcriptional regulator [Burkholderia plantarii]MBI0330650.1 TetR/AcrR family transcriptional regulator [Burkholderia plantarii]